MAGAVQPHLVAAVIAATDRWDVVVIGAGPAGALLSLCTARAGARVLLVDKQAFPRDKVCGGCLSARTVLRLRRHGLGEAIDQSGAPAIGRIRLSGWKRRVEWTLPPGVSWSRRALDAALVEHAVAAGAVFQPGTAARVGGCDAGTRRVELQGDAGSRCIRAAVVVDASGLGSRILGSTDARPGTRVGCSAVLPGDTRGFAPGIVHMAVGDAGYVGLVRLEDGGLNVAAALEVGAVRAGGMVAAVAAVIDQAGCAAPTGLGAAAWRGTPRLSQAPRRRTAERVFAVGDAAGYVEPFTGEGIGWALESAELLAPLSLEAIDAWSPGLASRWDRIYRARLARGQRACRAVSWILQRPRMARVVLGLLERRPGLGRPVIDSLHRPGSPVEEVVWP